MKALTMDMIAADLGVSKRTIYEFFQDKDELLFQSFEHTIRQNNARLMELAAKTDNVIDAIFLITEIQHQQMKVFNPVILSDLKRFFSRLRTAYKNNREKYRECSVIFHLLERGKREGVFRADLRIDIIDTLVFELIILFHTSDNLKMMKITHGEAVSNIFLPFFRGLCSQSGLELLESYEPSGLDGSGFFKNGDSVS